MVAAQVTTPCQPPVEAEGLPESRPAIAPPRKEATIPVRVHHRPAPTEKVVALGLSPPAALSVPRPMPMPSMFSRSWTTSAVTTPASTAPQETRLSRTVR